jgi:hypothetical protein
LRWGTPNEAITARNESEEIADLEGCCDQGDCQQHPSDVIAAPNSDRCGANHRQTNSGKKNQDFEAHTERRAN